MLPQRLLDARLHTLQRTRPSPFTRDDEHAISMWECACGCQCANFFVNFSPLQLVTATQMDTSLSSSSSWLVFRPSFSNVISLCCRHFHSDLLCHPPAECERDVGDCDLHGNSPATGLALAAYHGPPQLCVSTNSRWVLGTDEGAMGEESGPIKVNAHKGVIRGAH